MIFFGGPIFPYNMPMRLKFQFCVFNQPSLVTSTVSFVNVDTESSNETVKMWNILMNIEYEY